MFTGLVQALGTIADVERSEAGMIVRISSELADELTEGDSVAVNGVCLTATAVGSGAFTTEAMNETVSRTTLGELAPGDPVNLELPLRASDRLGGHVVQGHVDGVGKVHGRRNDGFAVRVEIDAPEHVLRYVVQKGSIAVDGVSLTVVEVGEDSFVVALIPETIERTNLGGAEPGRKLNLEVDVLAKYVERAIRSR